MVGFSVPEGTGLLLAAAVLVPLFVGKPDVRPEEEGLWLDIKKASSLWTAVSYWVASLFFLLQFMLFLGGEPSDRPIFAFPVFLTGLLFFTIGFGLTGIIALSKEEFPTPLVNKAGKMAIAIAVGYLYATRVILLVRDIWEQTYGLHLFALFVGFASYGLMLTSFGFKFKTRYVLFLIVAVVIGLFSYYAYPSPLY
ncbi:MAG: hypothetical protein JRN18_01860 [Nitrososphaerota archaeon]|nr:hypothetical protein [Nitrososphaerota archaeon]MDG6918755.1 hypothetical protein [Nitrososphaerota archaeon]MDG6946626.1 hypothetical protein [Nitrososphaerota archaeon]